MAFTSVQKFRFDDVDGAGIVYYPQFFHLCHAAFEDFFSARRSELSPKRMSFESHSPFANLDHFS